MGRLHYFLAPVAVAILAGCTTHLDSLEGLASDTTMLDMAGDDLDQEEQTPPSDTAPPDTPGEVDLPEDPQPDATDISEMTDPATDTASDADSAATDSDLVEPDATLDMVDAADLVDLEDPAVDPVLDTSVDVVTDPDPADMIPDGPVDLVELDQLLDIPDGPVDIPLDQPEELDVDVAPDSLDQDAHEEECAPGPGLCNGEDDDCDGIIDEGRIAATFELVLPSGLPGPVQVLDLEAFQVQAQVFAYLQIQTEVRQRGLLARFDVDGDNLVTQPLGASSDSQDCPGNPQITVHRNLVVAACDSNDALLTVYYFDAQDLGMLGSFDVVVPESWWGFYTLDLEVFTYYYTVVPPELLYLDADVYLTFRSVHYTDRPDVHLVLQRILVPDMTPPVPLTRWVENASAPSLTLLERGSGGDVVPTVLQSYLLVDPESVPPNRFVVEHLTADLLPVNIATSPIGGTVCPADHFSESDSFYANSPGAVDGHRAMMALNLALVESGYPCANPERVNTSLLYGWSETATGTDPDLVPLGTRGAQDAHLVLHRNGRSGAWLRVLLGNEEGWGYSYIEADGELTRESDDMPRKDFYDLVTTPDYFGVLSHKPAQEVLYWDILGCD